MGPRFNCLVQALIVHRNTIGVYGSVCPDGTDWVSASLMVEIPGETIEQGFGMVERGFDPWGRFHFALAENRCLVVQSEWNGKCYSIGFLYNISYEDGTRFVQAANELIRQSPAHS